MIIYNVTVIIIKEAEEEWLQWMKKVHIPDVMNTGLFIENQICKIFDDNEEGTSYAVQYKMKDMATFQEYQEKFAAALQKEHTERYKNRYVAFRTLMEVV